MFECIKNSGVNLRFFLYTVIHFSTTLVKMCILLPRILEPLVKKLKRGERERQREILYYSKIKLLKIQFAISRLHKSGVILYKWLPSHLTHRHTAEPGPTDSSGPPTPPDRWPDSDFRWPFSEFASDCFSDSCCGNDDSVSHTNCHHDETTW